jgi:hypothetical protein
MWENTCGRESREIDCHKTVVEMPQRLGVNLKFIHESYRIYQNYGKDQPEKQHMVLVRATPEQTSARTRTRRERKINGNHDT